MSKRNDKIVYTEKGETRTTTGRVIKVLYDGSGVHRGKLCVNIRIQDRYGRWTLSVPAESLVSINGVTVDATNWKHVNDLR